MSDAVVSGRMDRGFDIGVNMEEELYADVDGLTYPIVTWFDMEANECAKEDAALATAGRGFRWFNIHLGLFGLGPLAQYYPEAATSPEAFREAVRQYRGAAEGTGK